jgi:hypothetical protein
VYWEFADTRLDIYRARLRAGNVVRANDPVIAKHRFTNTYRACDRVSQYLITSVIYDGPERSFVDEFTRTVLFKLFNRIDTWEAIQSRIGTIDAEAVLSGRVETVLRRLTECRKVYSAAYIMPPPQHLTGPKAVRHLTLLARMLVDGTVNRVRHATSLAEVFAVLREVPSLGPFLAFQYSIDLCYGPTLTHDENEFVVPGPGALRGMRKCYSDFGDYSPTEVIRFTQERMEAETSRIGVDTPDLWGRPPQLVDLQNVFCEVDKYTRVARPDLSRDVAGSRIKQRYRVDERPLTSWFPPKWGINERAAQWFAEPGADGSRRGGGVWEPVPSVRQGRLPL